MWTALNAQLVIILWGKVSSQQSQFDPIVNPLILGDLFGMYEDVLYCRLHFEMMTTSYGPGPEALDMCPPLHSPGGDLYPPGMAGPHHPSMFVPGPGPPPGFPGGPEHWPYGPGPEFGPIPDYQFNNNNDPIKKRRGRKKRKVDEFAAMNGYMEVRRRVTFTFI